MAYAVKVQTRYSTTYTTPMSDSQTTMDVATAPANSSGFLTIRYGYSDQEDIYYANVVALQLTGMLRGLSPTALTPTEVVGLKKTHVINTPTSLDTVKMMTVHYVINDKPNTDGDETITGNWYFQTAPKMMSVRNSNGYTMIGFTNTASAVDYLEINNAATGSNVVLSTQGVTANINLELQAKGTGVIVIKDGSKLATSAAPTTDAQIANKKYVDDSLLTAAVLAEATTTQVGTQVEVTGLQRNYINPKSTIKTPAIYTPAYLTGDTSCEPNYLLWLGTSDGSFRITVDGTLRNITGIDFTVGGLTSMNLIAAHIQAALRTVTGGVETVTWSVNHFVIASGNTTSSSAITVTSATGGGTDISGAGAFGGLGCDTGHGTVTNKALDQTQDVNKITVVGADGKLSGQLLNIPSVITATASEINTALAGAAVTVTAANLGTLTNGGDASALHTHPVTRAVVTGSFNPNSGAYVLTHGLGVTPTRIRLTVMSTAGGVSMSISNGEYINGTQKSVYGQYTGTPAVGNTIGGYYNGSAAKTITVGTLTSTQLTLTPSDNTVMTCYLVCEVEAGP